MPPDDSACNRKGCDNPKKTPAPGAKFVRYCDDPACERERARIRQIEYRKALARQQARTMFGGGLFAALTPDEQHELRVHLRELDEHAHAIPSRFLRPPEDPLAWLARSSFDQFVGSVGVLSRELHATLDRVDKVMGLLEEAEKAFERSGQNDPSH